MYILCMQEQYAMHTSGLEPHICNFYRMLQNCLSEQKQQERQLRPGKMLHRTVMTHTVLRVRLWQQPHNLKTTQSGVVARLMEISLRAALLMYSLTLSQNCSCSSIPIICWIQSWRAMKEQKLCSMTLQKMIPGGKGLSSHYPHKINSACCCWTALCNNSGCFSIQINIYC